MELMPLPGCDGLRSGWYDFGSKPDGVKPRKGVRNLFYLALVQKG